MRTCRSRNPTCLAVAVKVWPSANSKMARARLASPIGVFWRRSHPANVVRVWSLSSIRIAEVRPCMAFSPLSVVQELGQISHHIASFSVPFQWGFVLRVSKNAIFRLILLPGFWWT